MADKETKTETLSLAGPLRQAIGKLAPSAPIFNLQALDQLEASD
jgi:hypothetical protein